MKWFSWLFLFFCNTLQAQSFTLKGLVSDTAGQAIRGASVMLYKNADLSFAKAGASDSSGAYQLPGVQAGSYYLVITSAGYRPYRSSPFQAENAAMLPQARLQADPRQLAAVRVTAAPPLVEVAPDKTVFNVQSSLAATGLSAFDLLRKAPGVIIDNQNNLVVEGKTGVKVFIDGRISLLSGQDLTDYLKTLQSTDVEAIEIITQPSARYDAAGTAGILNLRLKKNQQYGTNGSVGAGYGIGRFSKYNASASLNHRTAKLNIFSTYSNSTGRNRGYLNLDRFQSGYEYDQRSYSISNDKNHNLRAGLNYTASAVSQFGVVLNGNFNRSDITSTSRTPIINLASGKPEQLLDAGGYTDNKTNNLGANLNYRYAGKQKRELTLDADYGYYTARRNNLQPNRYLDLSTGSSLSETTFRMITPVSISLASFKADYSQPLGKWNGSGGFKTSLVSTDNTFDFYDVKAGTPTFNPVRSNSFRYREWINAAYLNAARSWPRWSVQAGVRAEQTVSDGKLMSLQAGKDNRVKRHYLNVFPSGGLTWKADAKNSLGLSYSRRVERPDYRSLNPFEYNSDELSFSKGNPFLRPQYTQTVKLQHTYQYSLVTSFSYSYISDFFAQITDTLGLNRNYISPQNIANQKVLNISISYPFTVLKWWSVYASVNGFRSSYTATNSKFIPISRNSLSFYGQNTFTLPKGFKAEVSGWYNSPYIWSGTYRTRSMGSLDVAVRKAFLDNKLSFRAAVSDILYTSNWSGTTQYGQLFIKGGGGYESRQLRLSITYNFGRKSVKAAEERKSGAEEEKNRIGNRP